MGSIIHDLGPDLFGCISHFLKRGWKQKHGLTEKSDGWLNRPNQGACCINIRLHAFFVPGIGGEVQISQTDSTHASVGYVATICGRNGGDLVPRSSKCLEGSNV